jgi:hypothetical protein
VSPLKDVKASAVVNLEVLIAEQLALHAAPHGMGSQGPLSTSCSLAGGKNSSGARMSSSAWKKWTPNLKRTVRFHPVLPFHRYRPGQRQSLNLRGPLDCKPIAANIEDDPIADYIVSCGWLRKIDDVLHRMRFSVRR